ncbi:exodeoxyribonuclease V subunit gamma [Motilimonas eburnea]|uniref:exodeoxyribonuclease V subunit gamma n=1 Tax=Motilimonas eburnea TaxID=1737488 RepID=UPI001E3133F9|nr:exodeoxyribonuclease V subunit gamma [Motilimonas eburnea]MCE2573630.1 exodeoxyribonuclease V subunit gamma [Motilimonas eburnea]
MFQLYHSNRLDFLKEILAHLIQSEPLNHPFIPEQILVQSPGMAQWLKLELADKLGITANIEFPLPASFIWKTFTQVLPNVPEKSPFNKAAMAWALMSLLPEYLEQPEFESLRHYLKQDQNDLRRYQLCQKVADIFDQYLVYRPQWITAWEAGQSAPDWVEQQAWQPILWRALQQKIHSEFDYSQGEKPYHRAALYADLIAALQQGKAIPALPKRLFVFGISAMAPEYLKAIIELGKHVEVHLFLTNPCEAFWDDIVDAKYLARLRTKQRRNLVLAGSELTVQQPMSLVPSELDVDPELGFQLGNPLLASMGKLGRDFLYQLHHFEVNEYSHFIAPVRDDLLAWLQADILTLANATDEGLAKREVAAGDQSLIVVGCHSAMREVEVLHDQLLAMFEQDKSLTPKDIIVMMPDVNSYSPYIQAVFGSASQMCRIPFSISDRSVCQENPVFTSFLHLLRLPISRCTSSELLELLSVPAVLAKFGINQDEFSQIRQWVIESGIRWGLTQQDGEKFALPPLAQNTWLFGLQRMLLGYAMDDAMVAGILPYSECQGLGAAPLGKLCHFVEQLILLSEQLQQAHSMSQWQQLLFGVLDDFYLMADDDFESLTLIKETLNQLQQQVDESRFAEPLSLAILTDYLQQQFNQASGGQKFLAGQVNFCTLMPMRSIPFKVICLLGMNDGVYPRSIAPVGFDLMAEQMQKGDRSRRDDDRYLFLEALCSAQQGLYISYVSRSIKDNTERTPSVLVSELLDYCEQGFCYEAGSCQQHLLREYPLQPFSPRYFNGEFATYATHWWLDEQPQPMQPFVAIEQGQVQSYLQPEQLGDEELELELDQLVRFFRHPCQSFFNQTLKVWFSSEQIGQFDHEPFSLDGLDNYLLANQILKQRLAQGDSQQVYSMVKAQGLLPHGEFGHLAFARQESEVASLLQRLEPLVAKSEQDLACLITCQLTQSYLPSLKRVNLTGWLTHHFQSGLVSYKAGGLNGKDLIQHWLYHLVYCAMGNPAKSSWLLGKQQGVEFNFLDQEYAQQKLQQLVELYVLGQTQPLVFFPNTSFAWATKLCEMGATDLLQSTFDGERLDKARKEALNRFNGQFVLTGEGQDPYIARCYKDLSLLWHDFEGHSQQVFGPLLANVTPIEDE